MKLRNEWIFRSSDYIRKLPKNPPEMRNPIQSTMERVEAANKLYNENFDEDGRAITKKGQDLSRYYGDSYWEDYPYTINGMMKWVKKLKRALTSYFRSEKHRQLEAQIQSLSDIVTSLRRRIRDLEDAVYKEDDE
jgi:hypothetical protein